MRSIVLCSAALVFFHYVRVPRYKVFHDVSPRSGIPRQPGLSKDGGDSRGKLPDGSTCR